MESGRFSPSRSGAPHRRPSICLLRRLCPSSGWYSRGDAAHVSCHVARTGDCRVLTQILVQVCYQQRGDVFSIGGSRTWAPLGPYELGMNYTGMGGHGDYGMDTLSFTNAYTRRTTEIQQTLIAAINDTNYFQGFIGLGPTPGKFQNAIALPFITQLASTFGTIPSHSYGYTAGAFYRDSA